jgi:hypothetical protein
MIESKSYRRPADPALVAAIRAHKAALAAGAAPRRRFTLTMAPRVPTPPEPPPAPTPPTPPDPTPPDPVTPDTDPSSMFSAANATAVYAAREEVLRKIGVSRLGNEVTSPPAPTRSAPPRWPDHEAVYATRRKDVERTRAAQRRRRE